MTRCLNLRAWQVRALKAGATQLWVPIFTSRARVIDGSRDCFDATGYDSVDDKSIVRVPWTLAAIRAYMERPFQPGSVLVGRETWARWGYADKPVVYRADADQAGITWKAPSVMPAELSRFHLPVVSCRPAPVREISHRDITAMGFELVGNYRAHFREQWLSDHGPRYPWETAWAWRLEVAR